MKPRFFVMVMCALALTSSVRAQDHVTATNTDSFLPELRGNRPTPDRDLAMALRLFNGQNVLNHDRTVGVFERPLAPKLRPHRDQSSVIAEGVVLRSDAFLTPDLNGVVTVLTVLPSAILTMPGSYTPPAAQPQLPRRGIVVSALPSRPSLSTLRFVLAGGTVYFDDNNAAKVRQTGVRYPAPGEALVLFGDPPLGDNPSQGPPSSVLLLTGACALQGRACVSIDGNPMNSDALTALIPGGVATALTFNFAGAAIASPAREGIRGLAGSLEGRYNLGIGDLRKQAGPEIPMTPFAPATADETFVRAHVLQNDASLTLGGLGVVTHTLVGVDRVLMGPLPKEHTIDVVQRGGLLWKDDGTVLSALTAAEYPLVEGGDYFLTVGRTSDNRWESRSAWRVVDDQVFSLDRVRTLMVARDATAYWKSTEAFLKTFGMR